MLFYIAVEFIQRVNFWSNKLALASFKTMRLKPLKIRHFANPLAKAERQYT
jgi:hypothetical protein